MILPKDIKSRNKIRDAKILDLYLNEHLQQKEIALRLGLTLPRINQIIYRNSHLLQWDKNREKAVRINVLHKLLNKHPDRMAKKATTDIVRELRAEHEGEGAKVEQHIHFTNFKGFLEDAYSNRREAESRID